jgi:hypothetical protein
MKIDIVALNGSLIRTVRGETTNRAVTPADVAQYEEAVTDPKMPARSREMIQEVRRSVPAQPTMPAFSQVLFDSEGNLWVGEYALPRQAPRSFTVFDTAGVLITKVSVPKVERVLYISRNSILASLRDEDDVPMVAVYRIQRN